MDSIKKHLIYAFLLLLACSCVTSNEISMVQPVAIDMQTQDTIRGKGIALKKGKVCYLSTTSYGYVLPDNNVLELKNSSNFFTTSFHPALWGSSSLSYQADTVVNSQFLVKTALEKVAEKSLPGFEYIYFHAKEHESDKQHLDSMIETFDPNYIITLDKLEFRVTSNAFIGGATVMQKLSQGCGETIISYNPIFTYAGKVSIAYDALWNIKRLKDNRQTVIDQKGEVISDYYRNYDIIRHLLYTAQQAGSDFLALLKKN